jgi:hypothetical protein
MGITPQELVLYYPRLYHVAAIDSWASITRHGLLSTEALLDLFGVQGDFRRSILEAHRPESVMIRHPDIGMAFIRDQKPMDDKGLRRALPASLTPRRWYKKLNGMVFFWLTRERVETFLNARAYRNKKHTVLTIDTARLLRKQASHILLSPINSGCTKPYPHPRGHYTFRALTTYPFEALRKKRGIRDAIVELAVLGGVNDVQDLVLRVEEMKAGTRGKLIWTP